MALTEAPITALVQTYHGREIRRRSPEIRSRSRVHTPKHPRSRELASCSPLHTLLWLHTIPRLSCGSPPRFPPLETARSWEISMVGDLEMEYEIG